MYTGILLSNKKEQTISTNNSTDESQKHIGQKKPAGERDYSVQFHVYKILENTNQHYLDISIITRRSDSST